MNKALLLKAFEGFLTKVDKPYKRYHRIADKMAPKVRKEFLEAIARAQKGIDLDKLEALLKASNFKAAENLIEWAVIGKALDKINQSLAQVFKEAAKVAGNTLLKDVGITTSLTLPNVEAERWIIENGAKLITNVGEETKQAIRDIILRAQKEGGHPYKTAREIKNHIGLTSKQAQAVQNMTASGKYTESQVQKYSNKLLKQRAVNIARTETIRAANMGQQSLWEQAFRLGYLSATAKRRWSTAGDERVCSYCGPMDGQEVGLQQDFSITSSQSKGFVERNRSVSTNERGQQVYSWANELFWETADIPKTMTELTPPLHPSCRCSMIMSF